MKRATREVKEINSKKIFNFQNKYLQKTFEIADELKSFNFKKIFLNEEHEKEKKSAFTLVVVMENNELFCANFLEFLSSNLTDLQYLENHYFYFHHCSNQLCGSKFKNKFLFDDIFEKLIANEIGRELLAVLFKNLEEKSYKNRYYKSLRYLSSKIFVDSGNNEDIKENFKLFLKIKNSKEPSNPLDFHIDFTFLKYENDNGPYEYKGLYFKAFNYKDEKYDILKLFEL